VATNTRYNFSTREDIGCNQWNQEVGNFPEAWLWHRWEAIDCYAQWSQNTDCSFALVEPQSGNIVALVPLRCISGRWPVRGLLRRLESTGGPAYSPSLSRRQRRIVEQEVRRRLIESSREMGAYRVDLSLPPLAPSYTSNAAQPINPLAMIGCTDTSTQSWVLTLKGRTEDELWRGLEHRVRKTVKRALRLEIAVREANTDDLSDFLRLQKEASVRNNLPLKPDAYYESIFNKFFSNTMAVGFCAISSDEQIHAIHVFGVFKRTAIYWVVASNEYALVSGANDLVQWRAICRFSTLGIELYESGEAFPGLTEGKLKGISDFKKGFGGNLVSYYRGAIVRRPIISAFHALLTAVRHVSRRPHR